MKKRATTESFWVSYSDLATGLMMVFILITCMLALQQVRKMKATQEQVNALVRDVTELASLRLQLAAILEQRIGGLEGVSVDAVTARVTVRHDVLGFGSKQTELGPEGRRFLDRFVPAYACALAEFESNSCEDDGCRQQLDPRRRQGLRRILVTGHADLEGALAANHAYAVQRAKNVVTASLLNLPTCPTFPDLDLQAYLEARLQPASGGEIEHCLSVTQGNSLERCSSLPDENAPPHRTVTFEVELVGEDVSGIAVNLVALDAVVSDGATTSALVDSLEPMIERCANAAQSTEECAALEADAEAMKQSSALRTRLFELCSKAASPGVYCHDEPR